MKSFLIGTGIGFAAFFVGVEIRIGRFHLVKSGFYITATWGKKSNPKEEEITVI